MKDNEIRETILNIFNQKPLLKGMEENLEFFDAGLSSLTVVDLQIQVEKALSLKVETSILMGKPTINGWVDIYLSKYKL